MPVYRLLEEMPYTEYLQWMAFFEMRPVGWREDSRFMKILQAIGIKETPTKVFHSLAQMAKAEKSYNQIADGQISMQSLKGSSLFSKLLSAEGGDSNWGGFNENTD